jgi:hypothetical protein
VGVDASDALAVKAVLEMALPARWRGGSPRAALRAG